MKNLFSVNKTANRNETEFDATPYLAAHVSDEVMNQLKSSFSLLEADAPAPEPSEEEKALKRKSVLYWSLCFGLLVSAFLLFFVGADLPLYTAHPYLHVIDGGLLIAALVFQFKARRISRLLLETANDRPPLDLAEASKKLEAAAAEAARELGVPSSALSADVLPFHYIIKNGQTKPFGKENRFDVLSVSLFTRGSDLCIATSKELLRIPKSDVRGYRVYDEELELDMWLKPEDSDSPKYQPYNIRRSGLLARKCRGYIGLDIRGEFELWVPAYDLPPLKKLLRLTEITEARP